MIWLQKLSDVSDAYLFDNRLSLKEKGVLGILKALSGDTNSPAREIARLTRDCKETVEKTIRSLEERGYIKRERIRGKDGRLESVVYRVRL